MCKNILQVVSHTTGITNNVQEYPTSVHRPDNHHVASEGMDVSSQTVLLLGATDVQQ